MNLAGLLGCTALVATLTSSCSVQLLTTPEERITTNQCSKSADCGQGATCSEGACIARSGTIDQVLLEIVPEPTSSTAGGLSFLSAQTGVASGIPRRELKLAGTFFVVQVEMDQNDIPSGCPYVSTGTSSIAATVEFARSSSMASISLLGLPRAPTTVQTRQLKHDPTSDTTSDWSNGVTLTPGTYDLYIQPKTSDNCMLPPQVLRGVVVPADGSISPSAPPATLQLPKPVKLQGKVQSRAGALAGWQVDLLEPQEGRVISTSWQWPAVVSDVTNFNITYQPVAGPFPSGRGDDLSAAIQSSPVLRIRPPAQMAATAPQVYWDLSAIDLDGDGSVSLDLSNLPTADKLVSVGGQVRDMSGAGVRATLQFSSASLEGTMGVTASFSQSVVTDATGSYTTTLFPGYYRAVAVPQRDGSAATGAGGSGQAAGAGSISAITQQDVMVEPGSDQRVDVSLFAQRLVRGGALAGSGSAPAFGATLTATPSILADNTGVWHGALAQTPVLPDATSEPVSDQDASFEVSLDPGVFDVSVRAPDGSNFGWWVWPRARITPPSSADDPLPIEPRLSFPIPLEGPVVDSNRAPLANAVVRAYAEVPDGSGVAKVGETRTDASGHYRLLLPSGFAP